MSVIKLLLGLCLTASMALEASANDQTGEIEVDMESRQYDPGEGIPLNFTGPIKVTSIKVLTSGQRNATLTAYVDGNIAKLSNGDQTYRYTSNWNREWVTFVLPYVRTGQRIDLKFGEQDPKIHKLVIVYATQVKTEIQIEWRTRTVYVPKSQMADKIAEIQDRFYSLERHFSGSYELSSFFERGFKLLFRAKVKANTHNGSDPDKRVGTAVDKFLEEFACEGVLDVYGDLAYKHLGLVGDEIEKLGISIFQLADVRRYDPNACSPSMDAWLRRNGY
jgi:hypothetical protein